MSKIAELESALQNPNVKKMLDLIGNTEGTDKLHKYNTLVGGKRIDDLTHHPNIVGLRTKSGASTAFGRYQITGTTWRGLQGEYGFSDFQPHTQDLAAVALLKRRGALQDVLAGDFKKAIGKLGSEWVSLPSSTEKGKQGFKGWDYVAKVLNDPSIGQGLSSQVQAAAPSVPSVQMPSIEIPDSPKRESALKGLLAEDEQAQKAAQAAADTLQGQSDYLGSLKIKPLFFEEPKENPYQQQLAEAFGSYPDEMKSAFPERIDSLIKSIYEAA